MSRVKEFGAAVSVPRYGQAELAPWVDEALSRKLSAPLRGPRGGTYQPVGEIYGRDHSEDGDRDFMYGSVTYIARRKGRYVRPRKEPLDA